MEKIRKRKTERKIERGTTSQTDEVDSRLFLR